VLNETLGGGGEKENVLYLELSDLNYHLTEFKCGEVTRDGTEDFKLQILLVLVMHEIKFQYPAMLANLILNHLI
jgi:hypothetical protein